MRSKWPNQGPSPDAYLSSLLKATYVMALGDVCRASASSAARASLSAASPSALEFRGDQPIIWISSVELPFGERRRVPLALELSFCTGA